MKALSSKKLLSAALRVLPIFGIVLGYRALASAKPVAACSECVIGSIGSCLSAPGCQDGVNSGVLYCSPGGCGEGCYIGGDCRYGE